MASELGAEPSLLCKNQSRSTRRLPRQLASQPAGYTVTHPVAGRRCDAGNADTASAGQGRGGRQGVLTPAPSVGRKAELGAAQHALIFLVKSLIARLCRAGSTGTPSLEGSWCKQVAGAGRPASSPPASQSQQYFGRHTDRQAGRPAGRPSKQACLALPASKPPLWSHSFPHQALRLQPISSARRPFGVSCSPVIKPHAYLSHSTLGPPVLMH